MLTNVSKEYRKVTNTECGIVYYHVIMNNRIRVSQRVKYGHMSNVPAWVHIYKTDHQTDVLYSYIHHGAVHKIVKNKK